MQSANNTSYNGTIDIYYWKVGGDAGVQNARMQVVDGQTFNSSLYGSIYVRRSESTRDHTYQVEI